MRKFIPHITHFFLLLSLTFVFPVKYWHQCTGEEEETSIILDFSGEELSEAQVHCDICDLVFTTVLPPASIELTIPTPIIVENSFFTYEIPNPFFPLTNPLRGPPIG